MQYILGPVKTIRLSSALSGKKTESIQNISVHFALLYVTTSRGISFTKHDDKQQIQFSTKNTPGKNA